MGVGFHRALSACLGQQHERANQFIAPLHLIHKMKLQLGKVQPRCHGVSPPSLRARRSLEAHEDRLAWHAYRALTVGGSGEAQPFCA